MERVINYKSFALLAKTIAIPWPPNRHLEGEHPESVCQTWLSAGLRDTRSSRGLNWRRSGLRWLDGTDLRTDPLSVLGMRQLTRLLDERPWTMTATPYGLRWVPVLGRRQGICSQARFERGLPLGNVDARLPRVRLFRSRLLPCQVDRVPVKKHSISIWLFNKFILLLSYTVRHCLMRWEQSDVFVRLVCTTLKNSNYNRGRLCTAL